MPKTLSPMDYVSLAALLSVTLSYLWLQFVALRYWTGLAGACAGLPLIAWSLCILSLLTQLRHDPSSHTLWPFEIALWTVGAAACLFLISAFQPPPRRIAPKAAAAEQNDLESKLSPLEYKHMMLMRNLHMVEQLLAARRQARAAPAEKSPSEYTGKPKALIAPPAAS